MNPRDRKIYVLLGRTGDILNLLPAIEYEARQNDYRPKLVVAKEYAEILDGCSYVEKVVYDGDFRNINHAVRLMTSAYPNWRIVNCAVYGKGYKVAKHCSSFTQEIWRLSKCEQPQISLPLVFDIRDRGRESVLLDNLLPPRKLGEQEKPIVILAGSGNSSPLWNTENIFGYFKVELEKAGYLPIDISNYKAERFYDLLGLYEKAHSIIAVDSAPLHLANATPTLPVISLISDNKDDWHRSMWRPNHTLRVLYSEVQNRMDEIISAAKLGRAYPRKYLHIVTSFKDDIRGDEYRRFDKAQTNWNEIDRISGYRWMSHFYRSTNIPKVKQMIDYASEKAEANSIIVISNADILFHPDITGQILHNIERYGAVYFHRWDFQKINSYLVASQDKVSLGSKWYPGSDVFAFSKAWWLNKKDEFPDMYFAREAWDMVMRNMIKKYGGVEIHKSIYHEKHPSFWEAKENRNCKENIHNRSLASQWLNENGGDWDDWKYPIEKLNYKYVSPAQSGT